MVGAATSSLQPGIVNRSGLTKDKYEALRKSVNWEKNQPAGGIFHAAAFDPSGVFCVTDVWESPETMDSFVKTRLMPEMQKLSLSPPSVEVYPLHNANAYKSVEKFRT